VGAAVAGEDVEKRDFNGKTPPGIDRTAF